MSLLTLLRGGASEAVEEQVVIAPATGQYVVEIDWANDGFGALESSDDVSGATRSVMIQRGRDRDLVAFPAGQCEIELVDPTGTYNPLNPDSSLSPNVIPMRPVRVRYLSGVRRLGLSWGTPAGHGYTPPQFPPADVLGSITADGFTSLRVDATWSEIEDPEDTFDWSDLDTFVSNAEDAGVGKLLFLCAYSPEWANGTAGTNKAPPVDPADYGRFCASVAARYSPNVGARPFTGGAVDYEIWNEPNLQDFLAIQGTADNRGEIYAAMLSAAFGSVKAIDPDAHVVSGGVTSQGNVSTLPAVDGTASWSPIAFLADAYEVQEWAGDFDSLGYHPYESASPLDTAHPSNAWWVMENEHADNEQKSVRSLMADNGDGRKKITVTEFGFDHSIMAGTLVASNWSILEQTIGTAQWMRDFFLFNWIDDAPSGLDFGLYDEGGTARAVQGSVTAYLATEGARVDYPLFRGWARRIEHTPRGGDEEGRTIVSAEDAFFHLASYNPSVGTIAQGVAHELIGSILDDGGTAFVGSSMRRLDDHATDIWNFGANGDTTALSEIESIHAVDLGLFYVDPGGTTVYETRHTRYGQGRRAEIRAGVTGLVPSLDVDSVVNQQRAGTANQESLSFSSDATSQATYGVREGPTLQSDLFPGVRATESYCDWIVERKAEPSGPHGPVSFIAKGEDASLAGKLRHAFELDVGDRIDLIDETAQVGTVDAFIESVRHTIDLGNIHRWDWVLSERPEDIGTPFRIGISVIGGDDVFVY